MLYPIKKVVIYPNDKPWVTKELKTVINKKKRTFFTGNPLEKSVISREVRSEIEKAKVNYKNKIEMQFGGSNIRAAWQGLKSMASINKHVGESKQHISINGVLNADLPDSTTFSLVLKDVILFTRSLCYRILLYPKMML